MKDVERMKPGEGGHFCTRHGCTNPAKWWVRVRDNSMDVKVARCDQHKVLKQLTGPRYMSRGSVNYLAKGA